jgi:hypothetical protein
MNRRPSSTTPRRGTRPQRGTTFAELMLATLIVGSTLVGVSSSLSTSVEVYHYFADGPHEALMLAQEIHEAALLLPWTSDASTPAGYGSDVYNLWDLDGKEYSPPRSADYQIVTSHLDWTQDVEVYHVDMEDPTVKVDPETFTGDTLVELKITISQGQQYVGEFSWWMTDPEGDM